MQMTLSDKVTGVEWMVASNRGCRQPGPRRNSRLEGHDG